MPQPQATAQRSHSADTAVQHKAADPQPLANPKALPQSGVAEPQHSNRQRTLSGLAAAAAAALSARTQRRTHCGTDTALRTAKRSAALRRRRRTAATKRRRRSGRGRSAHKPQCTHCGRRFTNEGNLANHLRTHRPQPLRLHCRSCGKLFAYEANLRKHSRICDRSGYAAAELSALFH